MRTALTVRETAFLLQQTEMVVRRRADLVRVPGHRVMFDADSVRRAFPENDSSELRELALNSVIARRFVVPPPASRWREPVHLSAFVKATSGAS